MSLGQLGWIGFLAGLPFAHFVLHGGLDIWQAQTTWAQGWLLGLLALSGGTARHLPANRPLVGWLTWVGVLTLSIWTVTIQHTKTYPLSLLMPILHIVFLWLFYHLAVSTWTPALRARLWTALAWSGALLVGYGVLQRLGLDQFYVNLDDRRPGHDVLVGTIGNPTHFGSHLALLMPLLLYQRAWAWRAVAGVAALVLLATKSATALLALWVVVSVWLAWRHPRGWRLLAGSLLVGLLLVVGLWIVRPSFFNLGGRWAVWNAFADSAIERPITGWGLGSVMEASRSITSGPLYKWRHVHQEGLQIVLEQGIVGVLLLLWLLGDWAYRVWTLPKTDELGMFVGCLAALLVLCLTSFPLHLWVLGSFGLLAYCGVYRLVLEQES